VHVDVRYDQTTQQVASQTHAWIPQTNVHPRRPPRLEAAPRQGTKTPHRVVGGVARITRSVEIRKIFDQGQRLSRGPLTLIGMRQEPGQEIRRIGVIVGRKFGGAVQRNRIKRRLREVVRTHPDTVPAGWDWLLLPRAPVQAWSSVVLTQRVAALFGDWHQPRKR
jgi:ribonuclease P protein component